ncbi:hypothetical protein GUITHDRAFT_52860, partial [Guillardia theta CCMP2712]
DIEDVGGVEGSSKEMLSPSMRSSLEKQGYKVVGSHSGVKLCRWTKSMLRGRGGCYKHTFYGIESHRCMEATPSLACANKCVGTSWMWDMNEPEDILEGCFKGHYDSIRSVSRVPGVLAPRLAEAFAVRHCALSLVGEPIMYPKINRFVSLLHHNGISTYLVTNAQCVVTSSFQLYVSIDAANPETLTKIDRPLFEDSWSRLAQSLRALKDKDCRTVYRLTLVKDKNVDDVANYAKLVALGRPHFIEIKGVTYCGTSKASEITMESVPLHSEVVQFARELVEAIRAEPSVEDEYDIASEHEHSCCILIASRRYLIGQQWHTHIDYDKFITAWRRWLETKELDVMSYIAPTPPWAVFGAEE